MCFVAVRLAFIRNGVASAVGAVTVGDVDFVQNRIVVAIAHGADGVQRLELVDLKPQNDAERTMKQVEGVMRVADAAKRGEGLSQAAKEGEKTRWEVRGEFVRFVKTGGPS